MIQHDYKLKKRCVVLKAKKMQSACFSFYSLASIELKKQSEHCMKDIQTHGTRFCAWYYGFCFCSHIPKSNLHCTRGITPKRVTSGGAYLRSLEKFHNGGEPLATLCRFDRLGNRTLDLPHRWRALNDELTGRCSHVPPGEKELDCFTRKASKEGFYY